VEYKIIILGSSYLTELVVERLKEDYWLIGHIPSKNPTVPGKILLPELDSLDVDHDIKLSIQYDQKLKNIDRAYNVHTGLLPDYGGCDILSHTIANGDREQGITFHKMVEEFDAGPIISKITYPVFEGDTPLDLYKRLACIVPDFVHSSLKLLHRMSAAQVASCYSYPPRMYRRGKFDLDDHFKRFRDDRHDTG